MLHLFKQGSPLSNSVALRALQADVGSGCEQTILQVLPKAVGNGECDDEGRNPGGYANDGNDGDHSNYSLTALSA
jgi:hypothetical protein